MIFQQIFEDKLQDLHDNYDDGEKLISSFNENWHGGYHTRRLGLVHSIRDSVEYASALLSSGKEEFYQRAYDILYRICELQDKDWSSKTYGLWSYYMEENLGDMLNPDYNWADFISKYLIAVILQDKDKISEDLCHELKKTVRRAAECSIKRNVAPDYTNISLMSNMVLISAGELLEDDRIFHMGKERLEELYEYTRFNGAFTEYNSSSYILVAIHEIMRMLAFFQDDRCLSIAEDLNVFAWDCLSKHYNLSILQLTPPQARAYRDLENGALAWNIYIATSGKFGTIPENKAGISLESFLFPPKCPEICMSNFKEKERWLSHTYYKKNNLRKPGSDTTIVRELDSPDLTAYSYYNEQYSMGAFRLCDCWNQRRNVMVIWGKEEPKYIRLRGMIDNYDFCSAMVYTDQYKNHILGHLGLVTDRGSYHYILDKVKNGVYKASKLYFRFELGGYTEKVTIRRVNNTFYIEDNELCIELQIAGWIVNNKPAQIVIQQEINAIDLVIYEGEAAEIDTNKLENTYGVFAMSVSEKGNHSEAISDLVTKLDNGVIRSEALVHEKKLKVVSSCHPILYREALEISSGIKDE